MRIAILHYTHAPVIGGVERVIRDQAAALESLGHEVTLFDRTPSSRAGFENWLATNASDRSVSVPAGSSPSHPNLKGLSEATQRPRSADALVRSLEPSKQALPSSHSQRADESVRTPSQSPSPHVRVHQWLQQADISPYWEPNKEITKHRSRLPHWQQAGKLVFVTWRLADSLPKEKHNELRRAKAAWEEAHPQPWNSADKEAYQQHFDNQVEHWLAAGHGTCLLRQREAQACIEDTLHHADGIDYDLLSYVVMPNHVHVLFRLGTSLPLEKVLQTWKSVSSRRLAKLSPLSQESSPIWQEGYRDRLIRDPEHLGYVLDYIHKNPREARLPKDQSASWECGSPRPPSAHGVRTPSSAHRHRPFEEGEDLSFSMSGRGRPHSLPPTSAVIVHNLFTMPFDLAWTEDLHQKAAAFPHVRWLNWVHDAASINPYYAHLPWHQADHQLLNIPPPNTLHVSVSEVRQADYARATGLPSEAIHIIPNGIDIASILGLSERITKDIQNPQWQRYDVVLFHPTRLLRRKNIELGLGVLSELVSRGVNALYLITGAPDPHQPDGVRYHAELRDLAQNLRIINQVRFLGDSQPVGEEDVRSLYSVCDALFFPSTSEGFGLPLLEALTHRLPIFCSDLPVHREVLGPAAHYFSLTATAAEIASQLQAWLASTPTVAARRHFWHSHGMASICQERLQPLLQTH